MVKIGKLLSPSQPALVMCLDAPAVLFVGCVLKFKGKKQLVRVGSLTFIPFVFILQGALKIEKNVLERNTY